MQRVGTALIGCGKIAAVHAQALSGLPESHFVAVCDADPARSQEFAQHYGVRAYSNVMEMLHAPDVQMVSICTPHPTHAKLAVAAAQARVHMLIEKPMAASLRDCDLAIAAAQEARVKLGVVSQRRFYEPVQRVKCAIEEERIGKPVMANLIVMGWRDEAYYRLDAWRGKWETEGGGVLVNQTPHQLDLLQWFMGPIQELFGYWDNLNHPYIEVEDTAIAVLRFQSGALGTIQVSNSQKPGFGAKIHIHGQNGASVGVQTDGGSSFIAGVTEEVEPPINDVWSVPGEEHLLAQWKTEDRARAQTLDVIFHYHELQIQDFLRAIIEGREPAVNGREGRRHVEIFTAIYRSQRDRRPVMFPLDAERGSELFDGRLSRRYQQAFAS
ncbi:MAG: Gfo/Idh/MocA family oxidoreductase [Chloroflexota bacterium]